MKNTWFRFVNSIAGAVDIFLYGAIVESGWKWDDTDVTPIDFRDELDKAGNATQLNIFINSPGGHISAGLSIYNMLKRHPAAKTVRVDGISASIANVISMAADKIIMPKTSLMLAHKPLIGLMGMYNAEQLLTVAADLDKFEAPIVAAYQAKTGLDAGKIREIMAKDTFMTAEEAVSAGFADEIAEEQPVEASIGEDYMTLNGVKIDLREFKNFPKEHFNAVKLPPKSPDYSVYEAILKINTNT